MENGFKEQDLTNVCANFNIDLNSRIYNMTLAYLNYGYGTYDREAIDSHLEDVLEIMNKDNKADVVLIKERLYYFYDC